MNAQYLREGPICVRRKLREWILYTEQAKWPRGTKQPKPKKNVNPITPSALQCAHTANFGCSLAYVRDEKYKLYPMVSETCSRRHTTYVKELDIFLIPARFIIICEREGEREEINVHWKVKERKPK